MQALIEPSIISGAVDSPQSKSIAIRLLFSSLLGKMRLENLEFSEDVEAAARALSSLGVLKHETGWEAGKLHAGPISVNLGGSGTTLRMLIPVLAYLGIEANLDGDETLRRRPLGVLADWLSSNGMKISGDRLPLKIQGRLKTDRVEISGAESSQYISGFIFGLLLSGGGKILLVPPVRSRSYIQMTCDVLNSIGAKIRFQENTIEIQPQETPLTYVGEVPGDFLLSSFYALGAILTGGNVIINNLSKREWSKGDSRIVKLLEETGSVSRFDGSKWVVEGGKQIKPFTEDVDDSPDMAVSLAALASASEGVSTISGVELLRTKESDRLESITKTLLSFDVVSRTNNGLIIEGRKTLHRGKVENWNDHRITMLGTVLSLRSGGVVDGTQSVSKSNPRFFDDLRKLGGLIELE